MLAYSEKLTLECCALKESDVETLRSHGFTDADVHDIAQTVGYYNFVNRTACGLGVELEPYWEDDDNG